MPAIVIVMDREERAARHGEARIARGFHAA